MILDPESRLFGNIISNIFQGAVFVFNYLIAHPADQGMPVTIKSGSKTVTIIIKVHFFYQPKFN